MHVRVGSKLLETAPRLPSDAICQLPVFSTLPSWSNIGWPYSKVFSSVPDTKPGSPNKEVTGIVLTFSHDHSHLALTLWPALTFPYSTSINVTMFVDHGRRLLTRPLFFFSWCIFQVKYAPTIVARMAGIPTPKPTSRLILFPFPRAHSFLISARGMR